MTTTPSAQDAILLLDAETEARALGPPLLDPLIAAMSHERARLLEPFPCVAEPTTLATSVAEASEAHARGDAHHRVLLHRGVVVGCVTLTREPAHRRVVVSYWLAEDVERRGLATRTLLHCIDRVSADLPVIVAICRASNPRSRAVARRLGLARAAASDDGLECWSAHRELARARRDLATQLAGPGVRVGDDGLLAVRGARILVEHDAAITGVYATVVHRVAPIGSIDPEACLAHNTRLAVGALGQAHGSIVLRHCVLASQLTAPAMELFLHEAERLRRTLERHHHHRVPTGFMTHYCD